MSPASSRTLWNNAAHAPAEQRVEHDQREAPVIVRQPAGAEGR